MPGCLRASVNQFAHNELSVAPMLRASRGWARQLLFCAGFKNSHSRMSGRTRCAYRNSRVFCFYPQTTLGRQTLKCCKQTCSGLFGGALLAKQEINFVSPVFQPQNVCAIRCCFTAAAAGHTGTSSGKFLFLSTANN